jgi:hypothetical protein
MYAYENLLIYFKNAFLDINFFFKMKHRHPHLLLFRLILLGIKLCPITE